MTVRNSVVVILTGPTSGLGREIWDELSKLDFQLIAVGRDLSRLGIVDDEKTVNSSLLEFDLGKMNEPFRAAELSGRVSDILREVSPKKVVFVSNAGVVYPIEMIGSSSELELIESTSVNFLSPAIITSVCVDYVKETGANLLALNISSGAAKRTVPGWSVYCATKAAAYMYFNALKVEAESVCEVEQLDPGVMDTKMQRMIRAVSPKACPVVDQFVEYQKSGSLQSPSAVAMMIKQRITKWLSE